MRNVDNVPCAHDLKSQSGLLYYYAAGPARFRVARVRDIVNSSGRGRRRKAPSINRQHRRMPKPKRSAPRINTGTLGQLREKRGMKPRSTLR
jgi:hypothetical protein